MERQTQVGIFFIERRRRQKKINFFNAIKYVCVENNMGFE